MHGSGASTVRRAAANTFREARTNDAMIVVGNDTPQNLCRTNTQQATSSPVPQMPIAGTALRQLLEPVSAGADLARRHV
jgi:hypothetical protein